jgi:hypothetical protein
MASRENTTIQVALILSIMTTITLAVFTYMFHSKAKTADDTAVKTGEQLKAAENKNLMGETKIKALMFMIGAPGIDRGAVDSEISSYNSGGDLDGIQTLLDNFDQNMQLYGQGMSVADGDYINYANVPSNLIQTIRQQNIMITKLEDDNLQLAGEKVKLATDKTDAIAQADAKTQTANTDLTGERSAFNTDRDRINGEKQTQAQALQNQVIQANQTRDAKLQEVSALGKEVGILQQTVDAMKILRQPKSERFEVPDGQITSVNQLNNTVWIDLGTVHGVKALTTFSVYDRKQPGVMRDKSEIKAKIQVVRILDLRLAEARILDDSLTNPILKGDLIHSPAFQAGTTMHFALAGFFDLDGDGKSDMDKVKYMITSMGGVIDAEVAEDGTRTGKVTVNTQYLLKGTTGELVFTKGYKDLLREIQSYDVEQLTFPTFLKFVGYKREVISVSLGRGADSSQFTGDLQNRSRPNTLPDETRKQRFPPRRGENGAF